MDQKADDVTSRYDATNQVRRGAVTTVEIEAGEKQEVDSNEPDLDRIKSTIEKTEARLAETIDAIQEKLNLDRVVRQAGEKLEQALFERIRNMERHLGEMSGKIGHSTMEAIKDNPIPATLLGLGIGWLVMESLRSTSGVQEQLPEEYTQLGSPESEALSQAGLEDPASADYREGGAYGSQARAKEALHKVKETAGEVREKASHIAEEVKERAKHLGHSRQHGTHGGSITRMVEEKPLMLGLTALAVGMLVGLSAGGAFRDRGLLRGAGESLKHKAGEFAADTREKAGRVAEEARRAAKKEAERQHLFTH